MSKIIHFSSFNEERCVELKIDTIKKELQKEHISEKKLRALQEELYHLSLAVTKDLQNQVTLTQAAMSQFLEKQVELGNLIYSCQNLFIDKQVDKLTACAQKLAQESLNPCKNVSTKIGKLQKSITSLTHDEALSLENRQMINLAKKYLHDAEARCYHEPMPKDTKTIRLDFKKANADKDLTDPYEISMTLHEVAGHIRNHEIGEALSAFFCLAPSIQHNVKDLMTQKGLSFDLLKNTTDLQEWNTHLYAALQILLGYSNQVLYGAFNAPSIQEIDAFFKDLDAILKEENSANF